LGRVKKVCKSQDPQENVKIVEHKSEEELLLATSSVTTNKFVRGWIIDNGCTNHMTHDL